MLGKLIKHEFKSTGRLLSFILVALMVITPITAFYLKFRTNNLFASDNFILNILEILCITLYVCAMIAAGAATVIILLTRFYQTMITKEAYLTHTLPVKTSSLITSKLIVACVWEIISIIVMIISIFTFTYILSGWSLSDINWDVIKQALQETGISSSTIILFVVIMFVSLIAGYLKSYLAFAVGHLFNKHPFAGFILAYIVISIVTQMISGIASMIFTLTSNVDIINIEATASSFSPVMNSIFILSLILDLVFSVACYIGTTVIFKKKLNI